MSRQFTVNPKGLLTSANKLGLPEGAMSRADTLVMRNPGKLTPQRVLQIVNSSSFAATAYTAALGLTPLGTAKIFLGYGQAATPTLASGMMLVDSVSGPSISAISLIESQVPTRARFRPVLFRDRLFLMNTNGLSVLDALDGTDVAMRWAGLPQPILSFANFGTGITVTVGKAVAYSGLIRRKFADGYEVISAPAPLMRHKSNTAGFDSQPGFRVYFSSNLGASQTHCGVIAGDVVELYRTKEVDAPTDVSPPDPGTTAYRVLSQTITSTDVSNGYALVRDIAGPNEIVGPELYTNPGQETLQSSRFIPPVAKCMAEYKGFMFYGNVVQPATWIAAFPGGIGDLRSADDRRNGIGTRQITTGTYSTGTNVLTGVSATEMLGIKVGQDILDSTRLGGARSITAVGGSSITFNGGNATTSGAPTQTEVYDILLVNGGTKQITSARALVSSAGGYFDGWRIITADTVMYGTGPLAAQAIAFGQQLAWSTSRQYSALSPGTSDTVTVRGTNGQNYDPPIPEIGQPVQTFTGTPYKNMIMWSWLQQPECVSLACYAFVGSGEVYQFATTRDVMWVFASDGLWRLTGYGTRSSGINANWRIDQIDRTLVLAGPNAFAVLRDAVFAYTNIGLVKISDAGGVQTISRGRIDDLLPGRYWVESEDIQMSADETRDEIWININTGNFAGGAGVSDCYIWHDIYGIFTKLAQLISPTNLLQSIAYDRFQGLMVMAAGRSTTITPTVWRHNNSGNYDAWVADYQPQFGPDPASTKTWLTMEVISELAAAGIDITPRINGIAYTANPLEAYPQQGDSRACFGIDIEAPATANQIAPGCSGPSSPTPAELRGIAMDWEPYTEERAVR